MLISGYSMGEQPRKIKQPPSGQTWYHRKDLTTDLMTPEVCPYLYATLFIRVNMSSHIYWVVVIGSILLVKHLKTNQHTHLSCKWESSGKGSAIATVRMWGFKLI